VTPGDCLASKLKQATIALLKVLADNYLLLSNRMRQTIVLPHCIRKVPALNLRADADYYVRDFSWGFSVSSVILQDCTLKNL
jgi:hypothetical protein